RPGNCAGRPRSTTAVRPRAACLSPTARSSRIAPASRACARTALSPRMTPRPARKSGSSTSPPRPASPAATPGPTCRSSSAPWGLPGSYDPKRKILYWGVANPNPYTRLTRHGRADAVPFTSPSNLYSNSTLALDVETGKLVWYYQELPGDDWDADHNQERILVRTRLNPDPRHVKWISSTLPRGEEREVVVTVPQGRGMFLIDQATRQFLS